MPWKSQGGNGGNGGGPWGGGGSSGGGGGGGQGPWGRGPSGMGGGPRPPDIDDLIRKGQDRVKQMMPGGMGSSLGLAILVLAVLIIWGATGFYRVNPGEQGVVLRFGQWINQEALSPPGLHYHWPYPIETAITPQVEQVRQIDVGFTRRAGSSAKSDVERESLMLTGDQNIIDIDFTVQWRIGNAGEFLFNIRDPQSTVKLAAESAMREVIGRTNIQLALSTEKEELAIKTRDTLQRILDDYKAGIDITAVNLQDVQPPKQVADAFEDVQRARQDLDTKVNQARAYERRVVNEAEGEAARIVAEAQGYRERSLKEAEGEAERFVSVFKAYQENPDVTRRRIYLETVQKVLQDTEKVILDTDSQGVVPFFPLDRLRSGGQAAAGPKGATQ